MPAMPEGIAKAARGPASLLVVNGRVFRPTRPGGPRALGSDVGPRPDGAPTAVAVAGEEIAAVGTDEELATWRGDDTEVIDARGGLVTAGFDDAHIHFRMGALSLVGAELNACRTVDEMLRTIRDYAAANPGRSWIMGRGWFYAPFGDSLPTKHLLDRAVPDRPAFMDCYDGHTGWANTKALEAAGITRDTPDPPGGVIVRDASGEPTGALKEKATEVVESKAPQPSEDEKLDALREACRRYAAMGMTSGQDAWSDPEEFGLYDRLLEDGPMSARMRLAMMMDPRLSARDWEDRLAGYEEAAFPRRHDRWLAGGILKGFVDGVVESQTAYMLEPYVGSQSRGLPNWSDESLASAVAIAHRRGWQIELHAIGDAGVRQALDAYEALGPGQAAERRNRIEHIETIHPDDIPRFGRLGVIASMQPYHADPTPSEVTVFVDLIGPERERTAWPWRSIVANGGVLALGSDWPVVPFDPFLALNNGVNRQTPEGVPEGGWLPGERLELPDALSAYAWGGAYAAGAESWRGSLEPGMAADIAALDRDLLAEDRHAIIGTAVTLTVAGGRIVHRRI
jgi:predicted amidohydrolase YtcJ